VDLSRDVLFQLTSPAKSRLDMERMDANVWPPLDEAIRQLGAVAAESADRLGPANVITDQLIRLRALRCWLMTHRNVAAWVAGVHGWIGAADAPDKSRWRAVIDDLIAREIANSLELMTLVDSGVEFMVTTDLGESPLVHGRNLKDLLARRIVLMQRHAKDDPFIDPGYMERMAGRMLGDAPA
jgi:hypothetical protein